MQFFVISGAQSDTALSNVMNLMDTGYLGLGVTDPDTILEIFKVGTQLKLSGGAADYATFAVAADGALTITTVDDTAAEGDIILAPDGNVGISSTDPAGKLTVRNDQNFASDTDLNSNKGHLHLVNANTTAGNRIGITMENTGHGAFASIVAVHSASGNSDLEFYTENAGTVAKAMTIKNDSLVSIGGSNDPNGNLDIQVDVDDFGGADDFLCITNLANAVGDYAGIGFTAAADADKATGSAGTTKSWFGIVRTGAHGQNAFVWLSEDSADGASADENNEVMRLSCSGYLGIGSNNPTANLHVVASNSDVISGLLVRDGSETAADTANILVDLDFSSDADLDGAMFIQFQDSDGNIGEISGDLNTTTYATSSDYRLKEDYKDIVDATGTINQLKLYDFAWKRNINKRSMGVIAHEAQEIVPTAITGVKDAMTTKDYTDENGEKQTKEVIKAQCADYSKFVPLLLKSIQELSAKVTALEKAK